MSSLFCYSHCNPWVLFCFVVVLLLQTSHLRCDVVWGAAESARGHSFVHVFLTHAKVCYLDVALVVQHHIVELQIPAAEAAFV